MILETMIVLETTVVLQPTTAFSGLAAGAA
jgi:hypothetical protein